MHLFVRDLSGHSLSFEASTLPSLRYAVADRTGVPIEEQRLVFGGRQLEGEGNLVDMGMIEGGTVGLVLRLRGGAPKKRCGFYVSATERCSSAAVRIVGDCSFCSKSFCGRHRLPEDHTCANLASCRQEAFDRNKSKLESEQTVGSKLASV
ncbi:hypothetical protein MNV49_003991 [Pseudohyphozyma bogoriensis]|nr:hypothetical protein MNV49_003991 [Pseudohyphozyma bogoriensis]